MALNTHPAVPLATDRAVFVLDWIALVIAIIGGLNWGLVGAFNMDLVATIFGAGSGIARLVYIVVGLAALYLIFFATKLGAMRR